MIYRIMIYIYIYIPGACAVRALPVSSRSRLLRVVYIVCQLSAVFFLWCAVCLCCDSVSVWRTCDWRTDWPACCRVAWCAAATLGGASGGVAAPAYIRYQCTGTGECTPVYNLRFFTQTETGDWQQKYKNVFLKY